MTSPSLNQNPVLPALLRLPLNITPVSLHNRLFITAINYLFKQAIIDDELEFLEGRVVAIHVVDANLNIAFTLENQKIRSCQSSRSVDLSISGSVYDFLLLASRREDPDTLFFNRRLKLTGDTELGLYVKNFLDAMDLTDRWAYICKFSDKASRFAERIG